MTTVLNESQVLAKTRCQDLYSVYKINFWGSGIKDVSLVRKLINVEVIGLSSNEITTLEDFSYCNKLKELIVPKNKIENIAEVAHLQKLPKLTNLWLGDNPCAENTYNYRKVVLKALPNLTMLDNIPVTAEELQEIERLGNAIYEEVPYESYDDSSNSGPHSDNTNPDIANGQINTQSIPQLQQLNQVNEFKDELNSNMPSLSQSQQQMRQDGSSYHDTSLNYNPSESRNISARLSQRPQSRTSMHSQFQHCRSLNSDFVANSTLNHGGHNLNCSMSNLNSSQNVNNNCIPAKASRVGQSNIVSAMLCLIKELDYSSCEVIKTALRIHMEETSQ